MSLILGRLIVGKELLSANHLIGKQTNTLVIENLYEENFLLPTLVIGWKYVKELFGDNVSILNKRIRKNLFWTFSPEEKLQQFNEDTIKFIDELYNDLIDNYQYYFIDPVIDDIVTKESLMRFIDEELYDIIYITDDFIYLFSNETKIILGIDIKYYTKLKYSIDNIITYLKTKAKTILIEDYTDTGVYQSYKKYLKTDFNKKYIPLLAFKKVP